MGSGSICPGQDKLNLTPFILRGVDISRRTGTIDNETSGLGRLANPNVHRGPAS